MSYLVTIFPKTLILDYLLKCKTEILSYKLTI